MSLTLRLQGCIKIGSGLENSDGHSCPHSLHPTLVFSHQLVVSTPTLAPSGRSASLSLTETRLRGHAVGVNVLVSAVHETLASNKLAFCTTVSFNTKSSHLVQLKRYHLLLLLYSQRIQFGFEFAAGCSTCGPRLSIHTCVSDLRRAIDLVTRSGPSQLLQPNPRQLETSWRARRPPRRSHFALRGTTFCKLCLSF